MNTSLFESAQNIRDFEDILHEVQGYISGKYALLITDDADRQKDQIKAYITKYLMDYSLAVEDMSHDDLVETLYSEMAEYSFLTKYLFRNDIEEININAWNDIKVTYSSGEIIPTKEHFNSPSHAVDVMRRLLHKYDYFIIDLYGCWCFFCCCYGQFIFVTSLCYRICINAFLVHQVYSNQMEERTE